MKVHIIPCLKDNYAYLLELTQKNILIDAPEFGPINYFLEKNSLKLDFILNTHPHWDHVNGNKELKEKYSCKILGSSEDSEKIPEIDLGLDTHTSFEIEETKIECWTAVGHTSHHLIYYLKDFGSLFCGDTLFSMGCGRLFEGSYQEMFESLSKIKNLPHKTKIYFGHEYSLKNAKFAMMLEPENKQIIEVNKLNEEKRSRNEPTSPSTLEVELQCNPFLRCHLPLYRDFFKLKNVTDLEIFSKLRRLRDDF